MAPIFFEFKLGSKRDEEQYKVRVYEAQDTKKPIPRRPDTKQRLWEELNKLQKRLSPDHVMEEPNPTTTLVDMRDGSSSRIDSQPATEVFRNIHFQEGRFSYAVVTVEDGAQLCFDAGYGQKLCNYIKYGLSLSYRSGTYHNIAVSIEKREGRNRREEVVFTAIEITKELLYRIMHRNNKNRYTVWVMASAKYARYVAKKATEKGLAKAVKKTTVRELQKKLPVVSIVMGGLFAVKRIRNGDWIGAIGEVVSGVAANFPGPGTAVSIGIDATLSFTDMMGPHE